MKKIILTLLLLSFASTGMAGLGYYSAIADEYDQHTGAYFVTVTEQEDGGFLNSSDNKIIDLYIFDPIQREGVYLFGVKNKNRITSFIYESSYDEKNNIIVFNSNSGYLVKNNQTIKKRAPKDKILVSTFDESREVTTLWSASKRGKNLKKIREFDKTTDWHIDVNNEKIRFVTKADKQVLIESIVW